MLYQQASIQQLLSYYMGKNAQERQEFIIDNLRIEKDIIEENETIEALEEVLA